MPRKSKPWWWASRGRWATTIGGKRITAPPEVVTEHDAWTWHARAIEEAGARPLPPSSSVTLGEVLDAYAGWYAEGANEGARKVTTATIATSCLQTILNTSAWASPIHSTPVRRLTPAHYDALLAAWRKAGYKPSYAAALTRRLKAALRWATKPTTTRGPLIAESPFAACKEPAIPASGERYGDRATAARWLRYLWHSGDQDDARFQRCLIHTGARPSELAWATWGEVAWGAMIDGAGHPMAIVRRAEWKNARKTGRVRRVFLPARLVRMMRRWSEGKEASDLIFPSPGGGRYTSPALSARTIDLREKAKEQGVVLAERSGKAITNYLWRHVAASDLLMAGVDVATVAELLGTGIAQIQRTYGHLLSDHLARASEKLGRRR